ncbi:MAG: YbaK/EbsC family protein [Archaeoglobaceae archaeon]|nr:YbaK/EbsC family protein [Archaeoglobaceae archaeon]
MHDACRKVLQDAGVEFEILEHKEVLSCEDVQRELGVPIDRVIKTLILKIDDKFFGLVTFGEKRVNFRAIEKFFGKKVSLCPREIVESVTGQQIGGLSPILLDLDLIVDSKIATEEKVFCGTGSRRHSLIIRGIDLFEFLLKSKNCLILSNGGDLFGFRNSD